MDEKLLNEIAQRVLSVAQPERIILFGSAAAGRMSFDSDIDLLVLAPAPSDTRRESVRIGDPLRGLGLPFDVIGMATGRFEQTRNLVGGLAYPASRSGQVIYEALRFTQSRRGLIMRSRFPSVPGTRHSGSRTGFAG